MTTRARLLAVYWAPAIAWAALILAASNDLFSSAHSGTWLGQLILRVVGRPLPPGEFDLVHFLIRKASHLTEYGILGALLFRAIRGDARGRRGGWAVAAVALTVVVAATDEWHQSFVPSRTASPWDVLLDGVGATAAQVIRRLRHQPANLPGS